jgi:hypothetical protein
LKNGVWRPPSSFERTYTSALKCVCGVIEPGFASTWPRSTSSRLMPRSSAPALSPACAKSSVLLEHLEPGDDRLLAFSWMPDDLDLVADLDLPLLDAARAPRCRGR